MRASLAFGVTIAILTSIVLHEASAKSDVFHLFSAAEGNSDNFITGRSYDRSSFINVTEIAAPIDIASSPISTIEAIPYSVCPSDIECVTVQQVSKIPAVTGRRALRTATNIAAPAGD